MFKKKYGQDRTSITIASKSQEELDRFLLYDCFDEVIVPINDEVIQLDNTKKEISFVCGEYQYNTVKTNVREDTISFDLDAWFDSGVNDYNGYLPKDLTQKILTIFPSTVGGFKVIKLKPAKISMNLSEFVKIKIENSGLCLSFTEEEFKDMFRKIVTNIDRDLLKCKEKLNQEVLPDLLNYIENSKK